MGTRIDKTSGRNYYEQKLASNKQKAEKKTLASIMKPKQAATRKAANAAQQLAKENQEFLAWALKNVNKQGDLTSIKDLIETYGTAEQRKEFRRLSNLYSDKKPKTWGNYAKKHGTTYTQPVSGVVEADKQAAQVIEANKQRAEYLKSIGLGDAKPTSSSGMTWAKYAQEHGTTYTQPVSGVVEADKQAARIIEANKQNVQIVIDEIPTQITQTTDNVPAQVIDDVTTNTAKKINWKKLGKYGVMLAGAVGIGYGIYSLFKKDENKEVNTNPSKQDVTQTVTQKPEDKTLPTFVLNETDSIPVLVTDSVIQDSIPLAHNDSISSTVTDKLEQEIIDTIKEKIEQDEIQVSENQTSSSMLYEVKENDNVWKIVKNILEDKLGRKPKNQEIADYVAKVLEKNDLKYEKDNSTVLIYPKDTLDIAS